MNDEKSGDSRMKKGREQGGGVLKKSNNHVLILPQQLPHIDGFGISN